MSNQEPMSAEHIKALSFEDALQKLEDIVQQLESGGVDLEKSIDIYTQGTLLKAHCDSKLKNAQARIDKITKKAGGGLEVTPAEIE